MIEKIKQAQEEKKKADLRLFLLESEIIKHLDLYYFDYSRSNTPDPNVPKKQEIISTEKGEPAQEEKELNFNFSEIWKDIEKELKEFKFFSSDNFEIVDAYGIYYFENLKEKTELNFNDLDSLKIYLNGNKQLF